MTSSDKQDTLQQIDGAASTHVEFDETHGIYRTEFDFHTRPATEAVIDAIATASGSDPLELTPLYSVVDPDALEALFTPTVASSSQIEGSVTFTLDGHHVTVHSYGIITVESADEGEG